MDESAEEMSIGGVDREIKELLGLFDVPAFARRGQDIEYALTRLRNLCRRRRGDMLDMVRIRLRQWAAAAGPESDLRLFDAPLAPLWPLAGEEPPARWPDRPGSSWKLRGIARDLIASVDRFNRRWSTYLDAIDLDPINRQVDHYNRYYLLEKECSLGSARLAARFFVPKEPVSIEQIRAEFPTLPLPVLRG